MAKSTKSKEKESKSFNPFDNAAEEPKKTSKSSLASHQAKGVVASAVDQYAELAAQIKNLEGKQDGFKDTVLGEVKMVFAKRVFDGITGNLKILGNDESVTFITQNSGSGLSKSEIKEIAAEFGKKAADSLTEEDLASLKFKPDFIASADNQKRMYAALAKEFSSEELAGMFQPTMFKVTATAIESAVVHVKSADELKKLYTALKLKAYIKV
jgi:hypothetical protein